MLFIIILLFFIIAFLIDAGLVWLLCWGLNTIGVHTIGSWTVQFSWPLVIVIIVITSLLSSIFKNHSNK